MEKVQFLSCVTCTGCAACMNACPKDCIVMKPDEEGFLYPFIEESLCIECGVCRSVCPVEAVQKEEAGAAEPDCYAAWSKDEKIRFASSSGGIFSHFAQAVLEQGGVVAGVRLRKDGLAEHEVATDAEGLEALKKSKYVQSEVGLVYREVKKRLKAGPVLFTGTSCQCAGLSAFLQGDIPENLYLCDLICHGVNSPAAYALYLREKEEEYGAPVSSVCFRDKTYDYENPEGKWRGIWMRLSFENGKEYFADDKTDPFFRAFLNDICLRPSCYQCNFRGISRPVDLTIADFWGAKKVFPDLHIDGKKGVSAVLVHSEKGKRLWEAIQPFVTAYRAPIEEMLRKNPLCVGSAERTEKREVFFEQLSHKKFSSAVEAALAHPKIL